MDPKGAKSIYDTVVILLEQGLEEIKILQTVTLLLTTNSVVTGDLLAKTLVLCFRLHFSKDVTTVHAAGATVRQLVSLVFERIDRDKQNSGRLVAYPFKEFKKYEAVYRFYRPRP